MRPFNWIAERTTAKLLRTLKIPTYYGRLWTPIIPFMIPLLIWSIIGLTIIGGFRIMGCIGEVAEDVWLNE